MCRQLRFISRCLSFLGLAAGVGTARSGCLLRKSQGVPEDLKVLLAFLLYELGAVEAGTGCLGGGVTLLLPVGGERASRAAGDVARADVFVVVNSNRFDRGRDCVGECILGSRLRQ